METGIELKIERIRAGVLQYDVARVLAVSPQWVSLVETGRKSPPPGFVERYRAALQRLTRSGLAHSRRVATGDET
jgi:transcriptional regulator with XRE-family HTH domain